MRRVILGSLIFTSAIFADILGYVGAGYSKGDNGGNMVSAFGAVKLFFGVDLRLEYTKNIDEHSAFSKEDVTRYGLFATYSLPIAPYIELMPKIGVVRTEGEWSLKDAIKEVSDSGTKFTYGLELDYFINGAFSIFVGYNDYGHSVKISDISSSEFDSANYIAGVKLHF
jgi:hypothetical protein